MVPPRGFLFLCFCGGCVLLNVKICLSVEYCLVKQHLQCLTLNDAKFRMSEKGD